MLKTPWAFLKRDFILATSYKSAFIMQLAGIFIGVPFIFFISKFLGAGSNPMLAAYSNNYFAFLLIGVALTDYLTISLATFNNSIRENQMMGTLEIIMMSPTSVSALILCSSLWGFVFTSIRFLLYLSVGLLFKLDLGNANMLSAMFILLLAILSFSSIGILIASITMVIKRGESLNVAFSGISVLLGGVIFPPETLPKWLFHISQLLPMTHALKGLRLAMLQGYSFVQLQPQILALLLFSLIFFPLGLLAFQAALRYTKIKGTLSQY